jgi:succinate dehydrogenase / fumarate reductase flavoprotein subunit
MLGTRAFGGASQARTYYVADITGQAILHVLYEQLMKYSDTVDRYEEWFTTSLIRDDDGNCVGCVARDIRTGAMEVFQAKSVIIASGGAGQAWKPTTNGLIVTGDGIAQAYRIGAPLMDMEMVQYHPTTLVRTASSSPRAPAARARTCSTATASASWRSTRPTRWSSPRATSSRAPSRPRSTRAAARAQRRGHLPRRHRRPAQAHARGAARDRQHRQGLRRRRHHARPDPHPPGPALHHGRRQDRRDGATPVPGLYAAGEVACVSVHGGNRLGANSLLDTLIFGRRAGEHAAARAKGMAMPTASDARQRSDEARSTRSSPGPRRASA